jgi:hypothetical protein
MFRRRSSPIRIDDNIRPKGSEKKVEIPQKKIYNEA